jgi:hypothetical protein
LLFILRIGWEKKVGVWDRKRKEILNWVRDEKRKVGLMVG